MQKNQIGAVIAIVSTLCGMPGAAPVRAQEADRASGAAKQWNQDPEWREAKYGDWGGPGVPVVPGPMDSVLLKDYASKSSLVEPETLVAKAKYTAIDTHSHVAQKISAKSTTANTPEEVDAWVKAMDEVGVDISVVLTDATGEGFDHLVDLYLRRYPTRFQLYCGLMTADMDRPDYPQRAVAELARCYRKGARGMGEITDKGWGYGFGFNQSPGERLHADDPRLDAVWDKCAELKIPVVMHQGDHPSAWQPLDIYQERSPDFQSFNLYGKDVPTLDGLLAMLTRAVAKHPRTTFVACHLANKGNDLAALGKILDMYPNLYVDIAARDYEIGRAPRAAARFLTKYQNRVLFGTDMGHNKSMYQAWWRLLETPDEYMPGRAGWRYYGLDLPDLVLESLYRGNARRIMNWERP